VPAVIAVQASTAASSSPRGFAAATPMSPVSPLVSGGGGGGTSAAAVTPAASTVAGVTSPTRAATPQSNESRKALMENRLKKLQEKKLQSP
jgi:hypothetical protein